MRTCAHSAKRHIELLLSAAASGRIWRAPRAAVTSPPWPTLPNRGAMQHGMDFIEI